jgi:hypothetical protein
MLSRFCEEFGCLPSALAGEDVVTLLHILDYRAYARAKEALDTCTDEKNAPTGAAVDDVWMVEHELLKRRREVQ